MTACCRGETCVCVWRRGCGCLSVCVFGGPGSFVKWPSPSALIASITSHQGTQPSDLNVSGLPLTTSLPRFTVDELLTHGLLYQTVAFSCLILFLWVSSSNVLPFLNSGAESVLNHKTAQGGSWQLPSLPAMSLPLGPNSWSLRSCREPGEGAQLWPAKPRSENEQALGREPATPVKPS